MAEVTGEEVRGVLSRSPLQMTPIKVGVSGATGMEWEEEGG